MLRRFAWGGGGGADKKRRLRAIWYVLPLPPSLVGKIFFASAWRYGYTGSVPLLRRKEEDSYETRNRWSVRDESLVRPNHLSPSSLPPMRFRVNFIGEAAMKDGWIWNAKGCRYEGEYSFKREGRVTLSCVTSLVTVQFTFLPRSTRREFYFPDRYICRRNHSDLSRRDLSRWNFLRELLVKIFNFNRFLRPRILLCF